jgi:6-pyruvoyl tetrahydropterin synthase/QueD family protein
MITISREYWFSAAHRLEGHPKCGRMHGHNYKLVVHVTANQVDDLGMIIDYGDLDKIVKPFIDEYLDHYYLVSQANIEGNDPLWMDTRGHQWCRMLPVQHSTAELMAWWIGQELHNKLLPFITLEGVELWETPKSQAVYRPS